MNRGKRDSLLSTPQKTRRFISKNLIDNTNSRPLFSSFFLKFLRSIILWNEPNLWNFAVNFLLSHIDCSSIQLYFSNYPKTIKKNKKSRLKFERNIYQALFQTTNYLLKANIKFTLETFTKINLKNSHLSLGEFEEVSRKLENVHFSENINKIIVKKPKSRTEKVIFVLKAAIDYCKLDLKDSLFKLTLLNSQTKHALRSKISKKILMMDNIQKKHRKVLWKLIAQSSTICNFWISVYISILVLNTSNCPFRYLST